MKTAYTINEVEHFLTQIKSKLVHGSIKQLAEGHTSQVFSFETNQHDTFIIRIRESKKDFEADNYAFQNFSRTLPIPEVVEIGSFDDTVFYAITPFVLGQTLNKLTSDSFKNSLPNVKEVIAKTFQTDISNTSGYGDPDFSTGNAAAPTWKDSLRNELAILDVEKLRQSAASIALPGGSVDILVKQFTANLSYVSEYRRLLHGDPGGDNVIVKDKSVVALIDWEQMSYGDWLRDFSRFEFWGNNYYGNAQEFVETYNLENEHIQERIAVYWAINALRNIEFADTQNSEKVAEWTRTNLQRIIS